MKHETEKESGKDKVNETGLRKSRLCQIKKQYFFLKFILVNTPTHTQNGIKKYMLGDCF